MPFKLSRLFKNYVPHRIRSNHRLQTSGKVKSPPEYNNIDKVKLIIEMNVSPL